MDRRGVIIGAALFPIIGPVFARADMDNGKINYRGFSVDVSIVQDGQSFAVIESSLKHQIDIVADCGAKEEIIHFFRDRPIKLAHIRGDEPGIFNSRIGVEMDASPQPSEKPILLHELLHAFHFRGLPQGFRNPDVLRYYNNAVEGHRYPPANRGDKYVLKNPQEFFAVTASLYLWGNVDRQPHNRENLKASQPAYYTWLGQLFGVEK